MLDYHKENCTIGCIERHNVRKFEWDIQTISFKDELLPLNMTVCELDDSLKIQGNCIVIMTRPKQLKQYRYLNQNSLKDIEFKIAAFIDAIQK